MLDVIDRPVARGPKHKKHVFQRRGKAIEMYIGLGMQIPQIAYILCADQATISQDITLYFKKPETELTLKSKIYLMGISRSAALLFSLSNRTTGSFSSGLVLSGSKNNSL